MSDLARGLLLQEQGRLEEAESCFYTVLATEPEHDYAYSRLALCQLSQEGKKKRALDSINEAIRIRSDEGFYHAVKALILAELIKGKDAVAAAEVAISLDPEDSFSLASKANAYCAMERWADAEEWSRAALEADADNAMASNILTHTMRLQGKTDLNEAAVAAQLAADPENSLAHSNAGWAALQRGDNDQAETHFREALRLDAESQPAREGLLESFRARSWFYRCYLAYCFFLQRFTGGKQFIIIIGLYLVFRLAQSALGSIHPLLAVGIGLLYLALVLWVWLARGVGNFLVNLDRSARLALSRGEKWQGIAVGGGLGLGLLCAVAGYLIDSNALALFGIGLVASTVPASLAFDNDSPSGRWLFGGITAAVYLSSIMVPVIELNHAAPGLSPTTVSIGSVVLLGVLACTWLGNVRSLRQEPVR